MSTYLGYTLAFVVIGLFAGYVSGTDVPGHLRAGYRYAAAAAGALAGGLFWLAVRWYGWAGVMGGDNAGQGPEAMRYAHLAGDTTQPGYWIGLLFAGVGSMLALAVYLLLAGNEEAH